MSVVIWHNPRCSKSRQTLALLEEAGHAPEVRLYLKDGPSAAEVDALQAALGLPLSAMMRVKDAAFKEAGLNAESAEADLRAALLANPVLLERPIVVVGEKAAIGRPPEQVLTLF
ncbi:arsenate reductase (glutaredoxin) [Pseudoruegeria sp. SHC-113]|uniref:arsenate reductase (glutaredoxin) n=1 Tax=Pseudoruegeria sp. SHC-113 TaxID=2855439 RepID=UPI0021BAF3F5|nr:arsenate reductase (glutaredoxin) [Pseudoruegeria sp. SHC-113]MCT8159032.1 arsenate reductase (glutaredoxin) [Pseudoruegeria sp. SHC-113]